MRQASVWYLAYRARSMRLSGRSARTRLSLATTTGRRIADQVCPTNSADDKHELVEDRIVTVTRDDRCVPEAQS